MLKIRNLYFIKFSSDMDDSCIGPVFLEIVYSIVMQKVTGHE